MKNERNSGQTRGKRTKFASKLLFNFEDTKEYLEKVEA